MTIASEAAASAFKFLKDSVSDTQQPNGVRLEAAREILKYTTVLGIEPEEPAETNGEPEPGSTLYEILNTRTESVVATTESGTWADTIASYLNHLPAANRTSFLVRVKKS
jgi:hypothetical protein